MTLNYAKHTFLLFTLLGLVMACTQPPARTHVSFNQGWKFYLGDAPAAKDPAFDDSSWRTLQLPHDWSIEGAFREDNPARPEGGALPTGVGWYRKTFTMPEASAKQHTFIDFDGVYRNGEVWINGHYLGKRPSGYSSFRYNLTPYLHGVDTANVLAVRVDNSEQPNSRWYTGSGIYRNVWLTTTGEVYVDHWGTFITTPDINDSSAAVRVSIDISGSRDSIPDVRIHTALYDADDQELMALTSDPFSLIDSAGSLTCWMEVKDPIFWSVDHPYRYKSVTTVTVDGDVTDVYETPFGIRSFAFDAEQGFFLNGQPLKLLGVCNHHDLGALGAAVNTRAIERQLMMLKAMGCNAIRTAHNPPAPELLDLCDRMGFIVMDEAFDVWKKKKVKYDYHTEWDAWHARDLQDMVLRDRNHPSVMMWSIGNEIREQFDSTGIPIAKELTNLVKRLDTSRPVTSALTENDPDKNFIYQSMALDLLGFNYKHEAYATFPEVYKGWKVLSTESMSALETRGHYDMPSDSIRRWPINYQTPLEGNPDYTVSAYDHVSAYWGSTHEETWKVIKQQDHMAGLFVWTGFDYLGEPIPYPWPARSSYFGIIDLAGFPKDAYYLYQSEWTDTPVLHVFPHWNWAPGQTIDVWAYYNQADEVELFLNGQSQGIRRKVGDDLHVMWRLTYAPGTLKAVSRKDGKAVLTREVFTAGAPAKLMLTADRDTIHADGYDLSFVTVKVLDAEGHLVPHADALVKFTIAGNGFMAGVDNGYQASLEPFKASERKAFNGLCLAIIQSNGSAGEVTLTATAASLAPATVTIQCR